MGVPRRVLKLGGSVLTCKSVPYCLDVAVTRQCLSELRDFSQGLVLVHGGGSFGHYEASKRAPTRIQLTAVSMQELNAYIMREISVLGIRAFPIPGRYFNMEHLERVIELGYMPVIYGDVRENGEIVSGDDLTIAIAKKYSLTALFATDVDGVIVNGKVVYELDRLEDFVGLEHDSYDVTGGMAEKLRKIFTANVNSLVFNGKRKGNIFNALKGERIGTLIKVRE
ncbi:uridylate kinase [Metallosphaera tengchongensis]|uniref:Isopentenyl phosphate kinase n=2 Tax=Metallosphaera tengchongensis TaxID=1532350 RepID=A0A6N0P166_9CREN|nr:uridylate kinase [Metallosphaera tengchongensis]